VRKRRTPAHHAGLLLQRFALSSVLLSKKDRPGEIETLLKAARGVANNEEVQQMYQEAYSRWTASFEGVCASAHLTTPDRLVVGLGTASVLETGLRLHHTYGTPLIPGSALKGLAAHYCHKAWGARDNPSAPDENLKFRRGGAHHALLFGTTDDGGVITFHDAWIRPDSLKDALWLDIVTPHHRKWQINRSAPTDYDSPVPVSYLSVAGTFDFRLSWSGPFSPQAQPWTTLALTILREALATCGVGGKTSSGYGRLVPPGAGSECDANASSGVSERL
jgi:CRISPR-associated protein Cmr6